MGTQGYVPIFSLHFSCVLKFKLSHYLDFPLVDGLYQKCLIFLLRRSTSL